MAAGGKQMAKSTTEFVPRRFLSCRHRQTILAALFGGTSPLQDSNQLTVDLPDGDQLYIYDDSAAVKSPAPPGLLVHGRGGSHQSS